jgi:hypothetical protein
VNRLLELNKPVTRVRYGRVHVGGTPLAEIVAVIVRLTRAHGAYRLPGGRRRARAVPANCSPGVAVLR